jgi:membrane fusion protein (multidrug efflux system)
MPDGTISKTQDGKTVFRADTPSRRRRLVRWGLLAAGPLLIALGALWLYATGGRFVDVDNAYVRANMIGVTTDVSGMVADVAVHDNQQVAAGDVLFRLDDQPFRLALDRAEADVATARNQVVGLQANWRQQQGELAVDRANVDYLEREFQRQASLVQSRAGTQQQLDRARHDLDVARQQVTVAEQAIAATVASLDGDPSKPVEEYAAYKAAAAKRDQARRDLDHTVVRAPVDGVVTNVPSLQKGTYLAAATPGFSLVATQNLWIEAEPKETELTWVRPGNPVTITIDTYPSYAWHGRVESLSPASGAEFSVLPAQNTSGNWIKVVQRIPVRVSIDPQPDAPPLRAGMSAVIDIDTGHQRALGTHLMAAIGAR